MNTSPIELRSDSSFRESPIYRVFCKTRTLIPTLCDGTCGGCKRERIQYILQEAQERYNQAILMTGGDPDELIGTLEQYLEQVQREVMRQEIHNQLWFEKNIRGDSSKLIG